MTTKFYVENARNIEAHDTFEAALNLYLVLVRAEERAPPDKRGIVTLSERGKGMLRSYSKSPMNGAWVDRMQPAFEAAEEAKPAAAPATEHVFVVMTENQFGSKILGCTASHEAARNCAMHHVISESQGDDVNMDKKLVLDAMFSLAQYTTGRKWQRYADDGAVCIERVVLDSWRAVES